MTRNDEVPQEVGEALARAFHEAYERLAPTFGYATRADTREFDPASPNGRLMIAVCNEVTATLRAKLEAAEGEVARLRGLEAWRDAVMDGNAVYGALTDYARRRTGPENVSDTLDAVAVVARAAALGGNANA